MLTVNTLLRWGNGHSENENSNKKERESNSFLLSEIRKRESDVSYSVLLVLMLRSSRKPHAELQPSLFIITGLSFYFFLLLLIGDRMNCGSLNFNENLRHGTKSMRAIESNSKKMQRKWRRDLRKLKSIVRLSDRSIYSSQFSLHQISTSSWKPNTQDLWTGTLILARLKLSFTATKIPFNEIPFNYVTLWYCIRFHPLLSSSIQFFMKDVCE